MIEIGNQNNVDLKESIWRLALAINEKVNKLLDLYEIFMRFEKRKDMDYDNREEIVYNDKLDFTIRRGFALRKIYRIWKTIKLLSLKNSKILF